MVPQRDHLPDTAAMCLSLDPDANPTFCADPGGSMSELASEQRLLSEPIDRLPGPSPRPAEPDALGAFTARTKRWGRVQVPLSPPVTCALWIILLATGALSAWLIAVLAGRAPCGGLVCSIATLGNPGLLLVLAGSCVTTLLGTAAVTRCLTRAGAPELAAVIVAAIAGTVSLLGVVAVLILTAMVIALAVSVLALIADRV
jgi:hypothetical protein